MTEAYVGNDELMEYYGKVDDFGVGNISQMPVNFGLVSNFSKDQKISASKVSRFCFY